MDKDKIIEEANAYISNDKSVEATAKDLGISRKTLQVHLSKVQDIDPELYKKIENKRQIHTSVVYEPKYLEEAQTYINSNKSLEETAKDLGISKKTLRIHLGKVAIMDPELHKLVLAKQQSQTKQGKITGGHISKATPKYTKDEAIKIAEEIVKRGYTYEQASKKFNIPKSTIYEMVHSPFVSKNLKNMLDAVAIANTKGLTVEELVTKNRKGRK